MSNIYSAYLLQVCENVTKQLQLDLELRRITILFSDVNPKQIHKWVIIDRVGNILSQYDDLNELIAQHSCV